MSAPWSNNFNNEDEIESDVMDSDFSESDSNDQSSCSDTDEVAAEKAKQLQEDEDNYIKFVQSVFCGEDDFSASFADEDDEEYKPEAKEDDNQDDDDDEADPDLVKVRRKELKELVDECWQTLAEPLMTEETKIDDKTQPESTLILNEDSIDSRIGKPKLNTGQSVISNLVSQIFSGEKPSEVCVEGMPVSAIRKLVARQMSMATQLLVQVLLQADEKQECFTSAYTNLMELSNHRESAIKKAKLIQMSVRSAASAQSYALDRPRLSSKLKYLQEIDGDDGVVRIHSESSNQRYSDARANSVNEVNVAGTGSNNSEKLHGNNNSNNVNNNNNDENNEEVIEKRYTRSAANNYTTTTQTRSSSVFDIPALTNVQSFFKVIDESKREIKQKMNSSSNSVDDATSSHVGASNSSSKNAYKSRVKLLQLCKHHTNQIMQNTQMRTWECLIPRLNYPLPETLVTNTDIASITGRSLFTPTEDDLLLRGIINYGESNWNKIKSTYLPSKESQLLQFRFSQMTSLTATQEDNRFKRYQKLEIEYRNRDIKWTHNEDLDLLRGFQIFGEKWPLIEVFFLPHRKRKEIKQRWQSLQKTWMKGFPSQHVYKPGFKTELTPNMITFLKILNNYPISSTMNNYNNNGNNNSVNNGYSDSNINDFNQQQLSQYQQAQSISSSNTVYSQMLTQQNSGYNNIQLQQQQQNSSRNDDLFSLENINQHNMLKHGHKMRPTELINNGTAVHKQSTTQQRQQQQHQQQHNKYSRMKAHNHGAVQHQQSTVGVNPIQTFSEANHHRGDNINTHSLPITSTITTTQHEDNYYDETEFEQDHLLDDSDSNSDDNYDDDNSDDYNTNNNNHSSNKSKKNTFLTQHLMSPPSSRGKTKPTKQQQQFSASTADVPISPLRTAPTQPYNNNFQSIRSPLRSKSNNNINNNAISQSKEKYKATTEALAHAIMTSPNRITRSNMMKLTNEHLPLQHKSPVKSNESNNDNNNKTTAGATTKKRKESKLSTKTTTTASPSVTVTKDPHYLSYVDLLNEEQSYSKSNFAIGLNDSDINSNSNISHIFDEDGYSRHSLIDRHQSNIGNNTNNKNKNNSISISDHNLEIVENQCSSEDFSHISQMISLLKQHEPSFGNDKKHYNNNSNSNNSNNKQFANSETTVASSSNNSSPKKRKLKHNVSRDEINNNAMLTVRQSPNRNSSHDNSNTSNSSNNNSNNIQKPKSGGLFASVMANFGK